MLTSPVLIFFKVGRVRANLETTLADLRRSMKGFILFTVQPTLSGLLVLDLFIPAGLSCDAHEIASVGARDQNR